MGKEQPNMNLSLTKLAITNTLNKLGTSQNGKSAPPPSTDNRFSIAWEYFVADFMASACNKRKEAAKKAAEEAGIITKPGVGETKTVYKADGLQIIGATKSPAERIDAALLHANLMKEFGEEKAQQILAKCKVKSSPATTFIFASEE
jgi:beta-phosphoglucomutase-like phosphatase (HAD superfamily)